jgi:serine kinase of HPr protein (carbohydrate metabolism regulator)
MDEAVNVHGTGLVLGGTGVLLRGPSGAGKSVLALSLMDRWEGRGHKAFLVSDDRVDVERRSGTLVMQSPPAIAGMIELRGRGIIKRPHVTEAPLDLVVDLEPDYIRMLEEDALETHLAGVTVPRCPVPRAGLVALGHQVLLVVEAIAALPAEG